MIETFSADYTIAGVRYRKDLMLAPLPFLFNTIRNIPFVK